MKGLKSMFLAMLVALAAVATAQVAEVQTYPQGKALNKSYDLQYIGSDAGRVLLVQPAGRLRDKAELVCFDMEQKELAREMVCDSKDLQCYGGYWNAGGVDLLMVQRGGNSLKVYRDRRDPATLKGVGEPLVLADYHGTEGDKMGYTLDVSPNQQLLAGVYVVNRETQAAEVQVGLYSRELDEYWKMDSRCRNIDFIHVTDSGEVVLGGYASGRFTFHVLDGESERTYSFDDEVKSLAEATVARYANGKLYVVASHSNKEYAQATNTMVDYLVSYCYDTRRNEVKVNKHIIDKQEYNRLNNDRDEAKVKKDDYRVIFMNLVQAMPDRDGCYAMFDQTWTFSLDGVPQERHRMGMMVCRIGDDGQFEWVKTFRISCIAEWGSLPLGGYRWTATGKGPLLVWAESKGTADAPEDKPVNDFKPQNSSPVLTALRVGRDGSMERQHFEMPSKQGLLGRPHQTAGGDYLLFIRGVSRGCFATLKLK